VTVAVGITLIVMMRAAKRGGDIANLSRDLA
jgi:hypothetical protein